jgi:alkylation response protein AidB-like acyl-CoA dehydrogenase
VTGQKIWTSFAQHCDYGEVLIRTDPAAGAKHRGLTLLVVDMHSPGVEIRPIRQIDGNPEFCEVFFDEVIVPVENVLGDVDKGWSVALSTLAVERGPAVLDMRLASVTLTDELIGLARRSGTIDDPGIAMRLAQLRSDAAAVRAMAYQQVSDAVPGTPPGPETTAIRAFHVELEQRVARMGVDLLGPAALESSRWTSHWLRQFMSTIGGGTKDVQKNIIGERVLGLPR